MWGKVLSTSQNSTKCEGKYWVLPGTAMLARQKYSGTNKITVVPACRHGNSIWNSPGNKTPLFGSITMVVLLAAINWCPRHQTQMYHRLIVLYYLGYQLIAKNWLYHIPFLGKQYCVIPSLPSLLVGPSSSSTLPLIRDSSSSGPSSLGIALLIRPSSLESPPQAKYSPHWALLIISRLERELLLVLYGIVSSCFLFLSPKMQHGSNLFGAFEFSFTVILHSVQVEFVGIGYQCQEWYLGKGHCLGFCVQGLLCQSHHSVECCTVQALAL